MCGPSRECANGFQEPAGRTGGDAPAAINLRLPPLVARFAGVAPNQLMTVVLAIGFKSLKTDWAQVERAVGVHWLISFKLLAE
jgi:hypothetical protein